VPQETGSPSKVARAYATGIASDFLGEQPRSQALRAFDEPGGAAGGEERRQGVAADPGRGQCKVHSLTQEQQAEKDL